MPVRAKSIYEAAEPDDGMRVLTTNYWPRGVSKERAGVYKRILGPTRELLRAFRDGAMDWADYRRRYLELMDGDEQQAEIAKLAAHARDEMLTVMCMCKDESQCHRTLLRELIEQRIMEQAA